MCLLTSLQSILVLSVLVVLVHFEHEMYCCAELKVGKENCVKSSEKVTSWLLM